MGNQLLHKTVSRTRRVKTSLSQLSSVSGALIESSPSAVEDSKDMLITENFITKQEEMAIMSELRLTFRRKYEYSHWDEVCRSYKCIVRYYTCSGHHWIQGDREGDLAGGRVSTGGGATERGDQVSSWRGQDIGTTLTRTCTGSCP